MKMNRFSTILGWRLVTIILLICAVLKPQSLRADEDGIWRKTIIVQTLEGSTMEYLIDKDTKIKVVEPNLIIETDGMVLTYELQNMKQVRYGKKLTPTGVQDLSRHDEKSIVQNNDKLYFNNLPAQTQINIFTFDGKMIKSERHDGKAEISISNLPSGIYFLKMNDETYKILKK